MSVRKFKVGMAAVLILGIVALFVLVGGGLAQGPALPPGEYDLEAGQYLFNVPDLAVTDTPVAPTDTPVPPTDTPVPPTPTPEGPWAGSPLCSSHDDRAWHGLFDYERGCHYNHEHKANPRQLDGVLGTDIYAWAGGEISYPWQTFKHGPNSYDGQDYPPAPPPGEGKLENEFKHEQYGWLVFADNPCNTSFNCIPNYRLEFHAVMGSEGAVTRFHSYWIEFEICLSDGSNCGILRTGGWKDYGQLMVDGSFVDLPDGRNGPNGERNARSPGRFPPNSIDATQYWLTNGAGPQFERQLHRFGIVSHDSWDPVDPNDPFLVDLVCPDFQCKYNNSTMKMAQTQIVVIPADHPGNVDGIVNYSGYKDRYGNLVEGCTEISVDCVPFELINAAVGEYRLKGLDQPVSEYEYDLSPEGVWWISYPN